MECEYIRLPAATVGEREKGKLLKSVERTGARTRGPESRLTAKRAGQKKRKELRGEKIGIRGAKLSSGNAEGRISGIEGLRRRGDTVRL